MGGMTPAKPHRTCKGGALSGKTLIIDTSGTKKGKMITNKLEDDQEIRSSMEERLGRNN